MPELASETPLDRAIRICGGVTNFAVELSTTPGTAAGWRIRGVPSKRVLQIEALTQRYGLQVDRTELAPDLYPPDDYRERERLQKRKH